MVIFTLVKIEGLCPPIDYWWPNEFKYAMTRIGGSKASSDTLPLEGGDPSFRGGDVTIYTLKNTTVTYTLAQPCGDPEYIALKVTLEGENQEILEQIGKAIKESVLEEGLLTAERFITALNPCQNGLDLSSKIIALEEIIAFAENTFSDTRQSAAKFVRKGGSLGDQFFDWAVSNRAENISNTYRNLQAIDSALRGQEVPVLLYVTLPLIRQDLREYDRGFETPDHISHREMDHFYLGEHDGSGVTFVQEQHDSSTELRAGIRLKAGSYFQYNKSWDIESKSWDIERTINLEPFLKWLNGRDGGGIYIGNDAVLERAKALGIGEIDKDYSSVSELLTHLKAEIK